MNRITNTFSCREKSILAACLVIQMWGYQSDEDIELDLYTGYVYCLAAWVFNG